MLHSSCGADPLFEAAHILQSVSSYWKSELPLGDAGAAMWLGQKRLLSSAERTEADKFLQKAEKRLRQAGLSDSGNCLFMLRRDICSAKEFASQGMVDRIEEIYRAVIREMEPMLFLALPGADAKEYLDPLPPWQMAATRWPQITIDITESSQCFALERFWASVFHILLVAEFGVIQVGNLMGVSGDKPGWGCAHRLERILKREYPERSELEKRHSKLLGDIVPLIIAVKESWRHKISHVDNKLDWVSKAFSRDEAAEIRLSTRGFIRRLAIDLPT